MNIFSLFNQLLSITILSLWSLLPPIFHPPVSSNQYPATRVVAPAGKQIVVIPKSPTTKAIQTSQPVPWGTTEKLGPGLYRTYVANDPAMGTPEEILRALNNYRKSHNAGELQTDTSLCQLALRRAQEQDKVSNLDGHKGFSDYMADQNHWKELNVTAIGENASYGYVLSGVHLIEWIFDSDIEHRENQLNPNWNLACAGTSGATVDIIFGKR